MTTNSNELKLTVSSYFQTDQGQRRPNNEDWVAGFEPTDLPEIQKNGCLYVVADGVGGASKGERASQYAAQKVLYDYYKFPEIPIAERLATVITNAGNEIYQHSVDNATPRMATTLVAAVIKGDLLTIANVGDSRAYLFRGGQVKQISRDHNLAEELVRNGTLTPEEAKTSKTRNKLMRSLGGEPDVDVDIFSDIRLMPGDRVLLTTDGLTRYASENDLLFLSASGTLEEIGKRMVDFANQSGGADNITIYLIEVSNISTSRSNQFSTLAPQPIDWDTVQTRPNSRYKVRKNRNRKYIFLYILIGVAATVIIAGGILLSQNGYLSLKTSTPTSAVITPPIIETENLPTATIEPTITPLPIISVPTENTPTAEYITIEIAQTPTVTANPELQKLCIYVIQSGNTISTVYELYTPRPTSDQPYKKISSCNLNTLVCDVRAETIENPDKVAVGDLIVIPGILEEDCKKVANSYWVTTPK